MLRKYKDNFIVNINKQCNNRFLFIKNMYTYELLIYNFNGVKYLHRIF